MVDSKYRAPQFGIDLIDRPLLLDQLEAGLRAVLTLVHGPAGYGKTALLVQWRQRLAAIGVESAWVSLDEDDRAAGHLIESIAAACGEAAGFGDVASGAELDARRFAAGVLLRLGQRAQPLTLILDDYHRAQSSANDGILAFLIARAPENVRLVIASRTVPRAPLTTLRSRRQLCEIGVSSLRFSLDETRALVTGYLNGTAAAALHERLEGWPLALQLAQIWLADSKGDQRIEAFLDLSRDHIAELLTTQVLAGLSSRTRQMLTATSIVEEFNVDLARILSGLDDVASSFDELRSIEGLVQQVHGPDRWHRCHQLLRDFLVDRLTFTGEDHILELHRRAADWFDRRGDLIRAVRHSIRARDVEAAAQRVEAAGAVRIGLMSGLPMLIRAMDPLPLDVIYRHPRLQVARAWMLAKAGALKEGRACYESVRAAIERLGESDPARHEGLFVDMMLSAVYEDDSRALSGTDEIERLARAVPHVDHWFQGWINNLLAIVHTRSGALANAREAALTALSHYCAVGSRYGETFMRLHLAIVATLAGRLSEAAESVEEAERSAVAEFPADRALRGIIGVIKAQVLYERNCLSEAEALLEDALPDIQHAEGWVEIYVRGFQVRAAIAYAREGLAAAHGYLDVAREIGAARHLPRLIWLVDCRKTELLTLDGQVDEAAALAAESNAFLQRDIPAFISWRERKRAIIAEARLAIRRGAASEVQEPLRVFRLESQRYGRDRAMMEISLMESLAAHALGDRDLAIASLKRALSVAVPERFLRTFVDEGEPMAQLLRSVIRHVGVASLPTPVVAFIAEVLAAIGDRGSAPAGQSADILSAREIEVLRHVALGRANKVIARALDVSEATVKFHLAGLYKKLGVNSRKLAVAVARQKQILQPEEAGEPPSAT